MKIKENNEMEMPGFTAEASLYTTVEAYKKKFAGVEIAGSVQPAIIKGCAPCPCCVEVAGGLVCCEPRVPIQGQPM
jgi:hypothetical protein